MERIIHPESIPDYMESGELRALQLQRLKTTVQRCYDNVKLFRQRMDERGMKPSDVRTLADVAKLPFTQKTDLRDTYPYGLFAVPMKEVVRLHASSGTTGKPIVVGYTKDDLDVWSSVMLRSFAATGMHEGDVLQNAYGYGLFTGGLGAHYGAERLGATVIPISGGNTERQILVMKDFGVTAICCTPSYFIHLIEKINASGISFRELGVKTGVFGAEPWTEAMRVKIEDMLGIDAINIYGLSEVMGPGVSVECMCKNGMHIWEDHFLPEIIGEHGESLGYGEQGDLTFTTLTKHGMPLLRYRTHDLCTLTDEPCACGRTHVRMGRVMGRTDDMLIIRGVNVFPSQVEHALLQVEGIVPQYQIVVDRQNNLDTMEVQVELSPEFMSDTIKDMETLEARIVNSIASHALVHATVKLCQPGTLPRSEGKAKRVTDKRQLT